MNSDMYFNNIKVSNHHHQTPFFKDKLIDNKIDIFFRKKVIGWDKSLFLVFFMIFSLVS